MKKLLLGVAGAAVLLAGAAFAIHASTSGACPPCPACPGTMTCPITGEEIRADQCPLGEKTQAKDEVPACCQKKSATP